MHLVHSPAPLTSESEIPESPTIDEMSLAINCRARQLGHWREPDAEARDALADAAALVTTAACYVATGRPEHLKVAISGAIYELLDVAGQFGIQVEPAIIEHHRLRVKKVPSQRQADTH